MLIQATLPGVVRMSEEYVRSHGRCYGFIARELLEIINPSCPFSIGTDSSKRVANILDKLYRGFVPVRKRNEELCFLSTKVSTYPFLPQPSKVSPSQSPSYDFPDKGPFIDEGSVRADSPTILAVQAFSSFLVPLAEVCAKIPPLAFYGVDVLVDRLVRDVQDLVLGVV